jgi:deoxyhypusine synthase
MTDGPNDKSCRGEDRGARVTRDYRDGHDLGLTPTESIDLGRCDGFSDLLKSMGQTSFGGRQLGEAADVLEAMVRDEDCLVVGTFSGAMTVAKQGLVLCDMIDRGMIDIVVSTGALMAHGLVEAAGMTHFKATPELDDKQMYYAGLDRVYDTLELEKNLDDLETLVNELLDAWPDEEVICSQALFARMGEHLQNTTPGRGILKSARQRGVPVYVPAFTDSELGLDFALHNRQRQRDGRPTLRYDPFLDLEDYTRRLEGAKRIGIFTIGGGVPRNWAQQVCCYIDLIAARQGHAGQLQRFRYGVRICPEPVHWGGLSGSTYSEGVSWGKFLPASDGGRFAEVPCDATIAWPLLVAGVIERLDKRE